MQFAIAATLVFLAGLLVAERSDSTKGRIATKPAASTAFIAVAITAGALDHPVGLAVVAGLVLSWFGDVFLISKREPVFLAGILSFLLGHVAYVVAFAMRGTDPTGLAIGAVVTIALAIPIGRWLLGHVDGTMKKAVIAYIVVISVMVTVATGATFAGAPPLLLTGAVLFFVSDITVARERFVQSGFANRLVGLPLYYVGQILIAATAVAGVS